MRALVTGAAGFVGSSVAKELLQAGFEVRALVRSGSDRRNLASLDLEIIEGDVRDFGAAVAALRGCQYVFHLAALYSQMEHEADLMYEVNVEGTKNLLRACWSGPRAFVERFVYTSTIGTIGRTRDGSLPNEATSFNTWNSSSHYVRSKYLGERAAMSAWQEGLPVTVVHPCAPVGPGDLKPTVTGQRILDYLLDRMPSFIPGGINFVDVEDVAKGHILAATKGFPGERYILGNRNLSLNEFLGLMELATERKRPVMRKPGRFARFRRRLRSKPSSAVAKAGPQALVCDCSRSVKDLGLQQTPLEMSFKKAAVWFADNGYVKTRLD